MWLLLLSSWPLTNKHESFSVDAAYSGQGLFIQRSEAGAWSERQADD